MNFFSDEQEDEGCPVLLSSTSRCQVLTKGTVKENENDELPDPVTPSRREWFGLKNGAIKRQNPLPPCSPRKKKKVNRDVDYSPSSTTSTMDSDGNGREIQSLLPTPSGTTISLPVWSKRQEILESVQSHQVTLIMGNTGSGKTTQVPRMLLHAGWGQNPQRRIAVTQPRRVAAISLARRVADELNCPLGQDVGYRIRFEKEISNRTRIEFLTDGMLIRELMLDNKLSHYSVIILDETHELSIPTEILLGFFKELLHDRKDLRLVIMSATLNPQIYIDFFPDLTKTIVIPGRQYAVRMFHTADTEEDYLSAAEAAVCQLHVTRPPGDILVFLPGQEEIDLVRRSLQKRARSLQEAAAYLVKEGEEECQLEVVGLSTNPISLPKPLEMFILPLYAALPMDEQKRVFDPLPPNSRKIVLSTNIAETSVTIPGITYVVDSGKVKMKKFNPRTGVEMLRIENVSSSMAVQRAGRAGREGPGECYRLYSEREFYDFESVKDPEIKRSDICQVILDLKSVGVKDIQKFSFLSKPSPEALEKAEVTLKRLGALDEKKFLTTLGRKLSTLPVPPKLGLLLLSAVDFGCLSQALALVATLCVENIWITPRALDDREKKRLEAARNILKSMDGDHVSNVTAFFAWKEAVDRQAFAREFFLSHSALNKADKIRKQLSEVLTEQLGVKNMSKADDDVLSEKLRQCLVKGFFLHLAKFDKEQNKYLTEIDRQVVAVHPLSSLFGKKHDYVIYNEIVETTQKYLRNVSPVEGDWLVSLLPQYFREAPHPPGLVSKQRSTPPVSLNADILALKSTPIFPTASSKGCWKRSHRFFKKNIRSRIQESTHVSTFN